MKKHMLLFLMATAIATITIAQDTLSDWKKENLSGNARSVTSYYYKGVEKFGDVVKDKMRSTTVMEFTPNGYTKSYLFDDAEEDIKIFRSFKYDNKNLPVEQKETSNKETYTGKIIYNEKGKITEVNVYDKKKKLLQKEKRKYAANGDLLEVAQYDGDGSLVEKEEYTYCFGLGIGYWKRKYDATTGREEHWLYPLGNFNDRPLIEKYFEGEAKREDKEGEDLFSLTTIEPKDPGQTTMTSKVAFYNSDNLIIEETESKTKGTKLISETKRTYEYDKAGNVVLDKTSEDHYTSYEYTYDEKGNWTRQVETLHIGSSVNHYVTERTIKYY